MDFPAEKSRSVSISENDLIMVQIVSKVFMTVNGNKRLNCQSMNNNRNKAYVPESLHVKFQQQIIVLITIFKDR